MMKLSIKRLSLTLVLTAMGLGMAQAAAPAGKPVTGAIMLQGGSDSAVKWLAPSTATYKVHVLVPKTGTATDALYRVYPKGKQAGSTSCDSANAKYPCFEVSVDQTRHKNAWVQLMLNEDAETQWAFSKDKGYVTAVADNLSAADMLNLSAVVHFEDQATLAIGKTYQGGIIFYVDSTGKHGLIAAPTDQSSGIQWNDGYDVVTGATGTAIGTGLDNTNKIIAAQGGGNYAAKLCADLVLDAYSDWYLPSIDELNLMYRNIGRGAAAPLTDVGGFAGEYYWSSSEHDANSIGSSSIVSTQYFNTGSSGSGTSKSRTLYVRAIRTF